jgi:hypothetical protein
LLITSESEEKPHPPPPSPRGEGEKNKYGLAPLPREKGWGEVFKKKPPNQAAFIIIFTALAPL